MAAYRTASKAPRKPAPSSSSWTSHHPVAGAGSTQEVVGGGDHVGCGGARTAPDLEKIVCQGQRVRPVQVNAAEREFDNLVGGRGVDRAPERERALYLIHASATVACVAPAALDAPEATRASYEERMRNLGVPGRARCSSCSSDDEPRDRDGGPCNVRDDGRKCALLVQVACGDRSASKVEAHLDHLSPLHDT